MAQAGKMDKSALKSSKKEQLKLKKKKLKKGKLKEGISSTLSPEVAQICSGNGDDPNITENVKLATAVEDIRNELMLKKKKRKEKMSQVYLDSIEKKKKKQRQKRSEGESKKIGSREKKEALLLRRGERSIENKCDVEEETAEEIASVDEDCFRGMKRKRDKRALKSSKKEQLKLKKKKLKKGKLKEGISSTLSPEVAQICFGNGDDPNITENIKLAMAVEDIRNELMLKKKKRKEKMSQVYLDSIEKKKKKKQRQKRSEGESKKIASREKKETLLLRRGEGSIENKCDVEEETAEEIASVDEDCSRGMKKWLLDYHLRRPGLEILQQRLSEFIAAYDAEQDQARKEREALAAEGGWTVVVHHKGRKKTTDSESGIAVGSVAQAAVEDRMSKKKQKELALDFYRFQKREAQRNEVMMLQNKFEQDKKRLQQLRAGRKFRPY